MKFFIFVSIFLINFISISYSQNFIYTSGNLGYYNYHEDNEVLQTKIRPIGWNYGFSMGYEHSITSNLNLGCSLSYFDSKNHINSITLFNGNEQIKIEEYHYQESFPIDLYIVYSLEKIFTYGFGISYIYSIRKMGYNSKIAESSFNSKNIFSSGLGIYGLIRMMYSITDSKKYFISPSIKLQFLKSMWYSENLTSLSDDKFSYLQICFSFGFGIVL